MSLSLMGVPYMYYQMQPLHLSIKYFADEEMVSKDNLSKIMSRMVSKLSLQNLYLPWLFQLHSETIACRMLNGTFRSEELVPTC